jgi:hypothetical protein
MQFIFLLLLVIHIALGVTVLTLFVFSAIRRAKAGAPITNRAPWVAIPAVSIVLWLALFGFLLICFFTA